MMIAKHCEVRTPRRTEADRSNSDVPTSIKGTQPHGYLIYTGLNIILSGVRATMRVQYQRTFLVPPQVCELLRHAGTYLIEERALCLCLLRSLQINPSVRGRTYTGADVFVLWSHT